MVFQLRAAVARRPLHYNVLSGRLVSVRDSVSAERLPARSPSLLRDQAACPGRWRPLPRATVQRAPCVRQQALELDCFAFAILDRSTRPAPARSCSARESTARGGKYFPRRRQRARERAVRLRRASVHSARIPTGCIALPRRRAAGRRYFVRVVSPMRQVIKRQHTHEHRREEQRGYGSTTSSWALCLQVCVRRTG